MGQKVCDSPCYNCPMACRKTSRTVCTLHHMVLTNITLDQGVIREQETLGKTISCEDSEEEKLCAPINCNYVNITSTCRDDPEGPASPLNLRSRSCPLCEETAWTKHCGETRLELEQFLAPAELPRSLLAATTNSNVKFQTKKLESDTPSVIESQESVQTTTKNPLDSLKEDLL